MFNVSLPAQWKWWQTCNIDDPEFETGRARYIYIYIYIYIFSMSFLLSSAIFFFFYDHLLRLAVAELLLLQPTSSSVWRRGAATILAEKIVVFHFISFYFLKFQEFPFNLNEEFIFFELALVLNHGDHS